MGVLIIAVVVVIIIIVVAFAVFVLAFADTIVAMKGRRNGARCDFLPLGKAARQWDFECH